MCFFWLADSLGPAVEGVGQQMSLSHHLNNPVIHIFWFPCDLDIFWQLLKKRSQYNYFCPWVPPYKYFENSKVSESPHLKGWLRHTFLIHFIAMLTFTPSVLYWIMKGLRSIGIRFDFWAKNVVSSVIFSHKTSKSVGVTPFEATKNVLYL